MELDFTKPPLMDSKVQQEQREVQNFDAPTLIHLKPPSFSFSTNLSSLAKLILKKINLIILKINNRKFVTV